jgi:hypothetical protein
MRANTVRAWYFAAAAVVAAVALGPAAAQPKPLTAAFTATTMGMMPAGLGLRIQVIAWSDDDARADVLAALGEENASQALGKLPTVGYVWPAGSPVGYTVKYAHVTPTAGGGERVTLVTDKTLGGYDYNKWSMAAGGNVSDRPYSVVELYLDAGGLGVGNLSLGADVAMDEATKTVGLTTGETVTNLLANVRREPTS